MASLAQTTEITRSVLKWLGILLVLFLLFQWVILPLSGVVYNMINPKKPDLPTVSFGKLPAIPFPKTNGTYPTSFPLQTTTGTLPHSCPQTQADCPTPNFPGRIAVYKFVTPVQSLSSLDDAMQRAQAIGFTNEGSSLTPVVYQWLDPSNPQRTLTMNIVTNAFDLITTPNPDDPPTTSPSQTDAQNAATGFLSAMNLLSADLNPTPIVTLLSIQNGKLFTGASLSEANFAQVDFVRNNINNLPVKNPDANHSIITFLIKNGQTIQPVVQEAHYSYKGIDVNSSGTYPLKTALQAYQELQQGEGYIAQAPAGPAGIQTVTLAYFEGKDPDQQYLYPVYVFDGEGFEAYVSAVTSDWITTTQP